MPQRPDHRSKQPPKPAYSKWQWLSMVAFALAVALVIARATMEENVRDREMVMPGSDITPRAAGATVSLVLDLLVCLPAIVALWRAAFDRQFLLRQSVSNWIFSAMALLAAISPVWASDKFAAAVSASHMVAAAALLWGMTQLTHSWVQLRFVAAACFGILLIYIAQGAMYRFIDLPDNIKFWQENQAQQLEKRGYEPGSFAARQFERKLLSGELYGFNNSPNTFAALAVLLGVVGAGVVVQRVVNRDEIGWAAAAIIPLLLTPFIIYYTFSRTAAITPILAAGILLAIPRLQPHWRSRLYLAGTIAFVVGCLALIGHGLYHGSLPSQSLSFRWKYWVGAAKVFAAHPLGGVGWFNFGAYYLGVRMPTATEEIKDPHNLIIRALVELGIFGGLLMVGWLARSWWELSAPRTFLSSEPIRNDSHRNNTARLILAACGASILFNILASVDFFVDSPGGGWFAMLELFKRMLFFVLLLLGFATILLHSSDDPHADSRRAPWILRAILAGLAVFLIHNLIDFSLFESGPLLLFAMLAGAALAARSDTRETPEPRSHLPIRAMAVVITVLWLAGAIGVAAPVAVAESLAQSANNDIRQGHLESGAAKLRRAYESLWTTNADYAYRSAIALQQAAAPESKVREMLDAAQRSDPMRGEYARAIAEYEMHLPQPSKDRAIAGYERAVALDPINVSTHKAFADALLALGEPAKAAEQYKLALDYNDQLPIDEPKRLPAEQVAEIQRKLQSIRG